MKPYFCRGNHAAGSRGAAYNPSTGIVIKAPSVGRISIPEAGAVAQAATVTPLAAAGLERRRVGWWWEQQQLGSVGTGGSRFSGWGSHFGGSSDGGFHGRCGGGGFGGFRGGFRR
jgi:hypothetical protein